MHTFRIVGDYYKGKTFPGLNEYLHECARHPQAGAKMKKDYQMIASNAIRLSLGRWKAEKPVILHYRFYEPNKGQKRDYMNIFSFADKVIEDALQVCKVIANDNPNYLKNTTHDFYYTDQQPYIEVVIEELEGEPHEQWVDKAT